MATPGITLAGQLLGVDGNPFAGTLTVQLCNFGSQAPRVVGTAMLAPTAPEAYQADSGGNYDFNLFGNDQITPDGTYYTILISDEEGNIVQLNAYQFMGTHTYDLSNVDPFIIIPVPPAPPNAVIKNPAGGAAQTIAGSIVITGNLTVEGIFTFNFGSYNVPINAGAPRFDGSQGNGQELILTQNVTSSTAGNFQLGIVIPIFIVQDGTGGRTMTWPANFRNPPEINPAAGGVTSTLWIKGTDGNFYPGGPAVWT